MAFHALLHVTEEELHDIKEQRIPITTDKPGYYCVTHAGTILIWPKFVPDQMQLLVSLGGEK